MLPKIIKFASNLLNQPVKIFWICSILCVACLIFDGSAFQIWSLKRDYGRFSEKINASRLRASQLDFQIQKAQELGFIERAARDQFDLVKEGDLVFIFTGEAGDSNEGAGPVSALVNN